MSSTFKYKFVIAFLFLVCVILIDWNIAISKWSDQYYYEIQKLNDDKRFLWYIIYEMQEQLGRPEIPVADYVGKN